MVTPHNKTWMDPDPYLRRLLTLSKNEKETIVSDVRKSMLEPAEPHKKTDWQLVTQRLEEKFAPLLMMLEAAFRVFENELDKGDLGEPLENVVGDLSRITYNIVRRYAARDIRDDNAQREDAFKKAVEDYASHTYPLTTSMESLIYSSIYKITHEMMTHIFDIYYTSREMLHDIYVEPSSDHHDELKRLFFWKGRRFQSSWVCYAGRYSPVATRRVHGTKSAILLRGDLDRLGGEPMTSTCTTTVTDTGFPKTCLASAGKT